jgi:hypothetical protein
MEDERLPQCPECGEPVNAEGKALRSVMNGVPHFSIVRLYPGRHSVPPLPA